MANRVKHGLAAEVVTLAGPYGDQPPGQPKTDAKGCVTYHGLIPGATYRIKTYSRDMGHNTVLKDFRVEAGKTAELEIVVKLQVAVRLGELEQTRWLAKKITVRCERSSSWSSSLRPLDGYNRIIIYSKSH